MLGMFPSGLEMNKKLDRSEKIVTVFCAYIDKLEFKQKNDFIKTLTKCFRALFVIFLHA